MGMKVEGSSTLFRSERVQGVISNKDKEGFLAYKKARKDAKTISELSDRISRLEDLLLRGNENVRTN